MTKGKIDWGAWLRAVPHATTFFGLAMIALIWGGIEFDLSTEYERSRATSLQNTRNLASLFEDHILRTIKSNDRILRSLQLSSVNGTLDHDFKRLAAEIDGAGDFTAVISLIDAQGTMRTTSYGPLREYPNVADREYFQTHRYSADAGLLIGKPVANRVTGKVVIQLTRALRGSHGSFDGVVVASLNTDKLVKFYESVDLGQDGAISLTGLDGIIRASAGFKVDTVGRSMAQSELLRHVASADEGSYRSRGIIDGIPRLISFRLVDGYPLAVWVGRAEHVIFETFWANSYSYRFVAAGLTLFITIVIFLNIRHRKGLERAREKLRASETVARERTHELQLTLDYMSQGIMMIDADLDVALINRQVIKLLDLPQDFIGSRPKFQDVLTHQWKSGEFGSDGSAVEPEVRRFIEDGGLSKVEGVYERVRPNGTVLEVRSIPMPDGGFVRTFTDISERKRNEDKIAHMAHHDELTGLANRALLRSHIEAAMGREHRQGEGFALLLIDLDRFKAVNDTLGHGAGDTLLKEVAGRLRDCVRDGDTIARLGGDEFAIVEALTDDRECIDRLARRVLNSISAPYAIDGKRANIGVSIGIARSVDCADIEELFQNADVALYRVKSGGRNNYRVFEPIMDAEAQARRELEAELREARERGEFEIHYQPIFNIATGAVASVEALLRWNYPVRGRVSPADFLPLAEEIGLMPAIDTWVLETAAAEATMWPASVGIAVNLSPAKFKRRNLVETVRSALSRSGLPPHRLELEISERTLLREDDGNLAALLSLRALGVRIALDDFGTGNTSLSDLSAFQFDKIKIDQSFVTEMEHRHDCAAIVAAIAGLGRSLGSETTAEGVETETQAELVRAAGCTQAQGYLYSRPVTASAIKALLSGGAKRAVA